MFSQNATQRYRYGLGGQGYQYNNQIGNNPLPSGFQGTVNKAYTRTPQQNELVSHQLTGLLASDSPYIQNARQSGIEQAASRGMLNSSLAAGNSQREAIAAGMPIAAADAGAFGTAASENLGYLNQMAQQEAQISGQERIANANRQAAGANAASDSAAALQRQREALAFQGEQAGLDRNQQLGMAQFGLGANLTQLGYGAQWDNWLGDQNMGRQMERDLYGTQLGMIRDYGSFLNNSMANAFDQGMFNPEMMANPQQMSNMIGGMSQMSMQAFNTFFSNFFGSGNAGGRP